MPEWAQAGIIEEKSKPMVTILQWIRDRVVKFYTHVPYNKIKRKFGFTCTNCRWQGIRPLWDSQGLGMTSMTTTLRLALPIRCRECNTKHARYKRARRAMEKITRDLKARPGLRAWFVTLTKPNKIFSAGDTIDIEADKADWIAEFRKLRQRKVWKETFAGGYWFYEYTVHSPGDKIFDDRGCFIREVKDFEMNGHIHVLATAEGHIPMQEISRDWDGRIDMRWKDVRTGRPISEKTIMRYLRGYLTKSSSSGVNMRPFGDIHRSRN